MIKIKNESARNTAAKIVGVLLLIQMFAGIWLNFFFYKPIFSSAAQLSSSNTHMMVGVGVLLAIFLSAINFIVCLVCRPLLNGKFQSHFICAVSVAAIALCFTAIESNQLSELASWLIYTKDLELASSPSSKNELALLNEHIRHVLATSRNNTHYMAMLISSSSLFIFYSLLLRARLLPKSLMYFAVAACFLQLIAIVHAQFGRSIPQLLQLPLAVNQLVMPLYLIFKGFKK